MLEFLDDVFCLAVCKGDVVWICGEVSSTSDYFPVVWMGVKVADLREMLDEDVSLLFI